jgi:predicted ATPase
MLPHFRDGAWFCELATAGDPDALVQVVAATLGVQPHPTVPLDQRIRDSLRERRALILLDNCEHLLDSATRTAEGILRECAHVRLVATSREPLDVEGERIVRVRSLPFPSAGTDFAATDAVQLFVERAQSVESDFDADDATRTVGEICRRLDGIPLAIELAAARVVAMTPAEIAELLDERFRLLTGGRRTAVERHQTLRATVDWSYSLLEPSEQLVFDRLGVFPGSFDATAARAVTAGDGVEDWDVRDALTGLVNKSMVNTLSGSPGTTRYQLLETMRQYARERLDETGDADRRRRAHAEHYAKLADTVGVAMLTGESLDRLRTTAQEDLDNYRAAVTWGLDSDAPGDSDLALRIAVSLAGMEPGTRRAAGLIAQSGRLLERAEASSRELRAGVLAGMANDALMLRGDLEGAESYAQRALAEGPISSGLAFSYATLAICALANGEFDRAHEILVEGQGATDQLRGDVSHWHAYYEMLLANVEGQRGDQIAAQRHARDAVRLARESEFPYRLAQALGVLGRALRYDDPDGARRAADEALHLARQQPAMGGLGNALMGQADLAALSGAPREAIALFREATLAWGDVVPIMVLVASASRASRILADLDEPTTAARLGGVATRGPRANLLVTTIDRRGRDDLERTLKRLRARLGDDVFESEMERGAAMSSDEVLRFMRDAAEEALRH